MWFPRGIGIVWPLTPFSLLQPSPRESRTFRKLTIGMMTAFTTKPWEPTFPSFLGVITHILGFKTFIFHGFGVQG